MKKTSLLFILMLLAACTTPPTTVKPTPTAFLTTETRTPPLKLPLPIGTLPPGPPSSATDPSTPTLSPTTTATSAATRPATSTLAAVETFTEQLAPALTPSAEQTCKAMATQEQRGLYVLYVRPSEKLVWDMAPRQFIVGLCNSLSVPLVPESHFVVSVHIPFRSEGGGQTSQIIAQLSPGFHEITFGSWTPGLESHVTICVQKPAVQVIVGYSDQERSSNFRPLAFPDGKNSLVLPVECGGSYA